MKVRREPRLPLGLTSILAIASILSLPSLMGPEVSLFASSFSPVANRIRIITTNNVQMAPSRRTICNAKLLKKLNKIASNFDLDEILSNEKEFNAADEDITATTSLKKKKGPKRKNNKNHEKKLALKEQMKREKLEKQQVRKSLKEQDSSDDSTSWKSDTSDDLAEEESSIDHEALMKSIDFMSLEVPSPLDGKRIDAVLVDLLNDGNDQTVTISRSQCGTLLSNECVFVIPAENTTEFMKEWKAEGDTASSAPYNLIERYGSAVERKSQPLEADSILVYPSRGSLLSASSSSTLLSNFLPPTEIIAQNIPLNILFEDEHLIVLNKQAGMVVHPAAGNWDGTLVNALAYYLMNESPFGAGEFFADDEKEEGISDDADANQNFDAVTNSISTLRPGIVHRLDKGTTGVIVVAKTSSALSTLSEAFAKRKVKKEYLAVAIGNPGEDQWINKPIGRHPQHRQRMRVVPDPNSSMSSRGQPRLTGVKSASVAKQGRQALSHIHTIHYDGKLSVVQVRIATGRTHQIRVHLQDHGTPVYGDDVYGLSDWNKALSSRRGVVRPLLHAQRLEIDHPVTGENLVFEAQVADDMMGVIKAIWPAGEELKF